MIIDETSAGRLPLHPLEHSADPEQGNTAGGPGLGAVCCLRFGDVDLFVVLVHDGLGVGTVMAVSAGVIIAVLAMLDGDDLVHWSIAQTRNRETQPEGLGWELFRNYLIARERYGPDFYLYENNKSMAPHSTFPAILDVWE